VQTANRKHRTIVEKGLAKRGVFPSQGQTVTAEINHGRWVAHCPCNGAELVAPGEEMLCGSCGARHQPKFPGAQTMTRIEAVLDQRPPYNQNWDPSETADELLAQNIEHGITPKDY